MFAHTHTHAIGLRLMEMTADNAFEIMSNGSEDDFRRKTKNQFLIVVDRQRLTNINIYVTGLGYLWPANEHHKLLVLLTTTKVHIIFSLFFHFVFTLKFTFGYMITDTDFDHTNSPFTIDSGRTKILCACSEFEKRPANGDSWQTYCT